MSLNGLNDAAERHPVRWALVAGLAVGSIYGVLWRSVFGGVVFGLSIGVIQLVSAIVRRSLRNRHKTN